MIKGLTLIPLSYLIKIFTHLKLCIATATHNFKWLKITHVCYSEAKNVQILMFKHKFIANDCYLINNKTMTVVLSSEGVNPCPAELFKLYFLSFEAGIANAISSSK